MLKYKQSRGINAVFLAVLCLGVLCFSGQALAAYEVNSTAAEQDSNVAFGKTPIAWDWDTDGDVTINWPAPSDTGNDYVLNYFYAWNSSKEFEGSTITRHNNDGNSTGEACQVLGNKTFFENRGYADGTQWAYLYVRTYYVNASNQNEYSDPVRLGPINVDSVHPQGSIQLVDSEGKSIGYTISANVNLSLGATGDTKFYHINESGRTPSASEIDTVYNSTDVSYDIQGGTGSVTLYAWFKDEAGNISQAPATSEFEYVGGVHVDPYETELVLSGTKSQTFQVSDGNTYDWEVVNASGTNVAYIDGNSSNTAQVTLVGNNTGTCKLKATGNGEVTSGEITVKQGYLKGDANGDGKINAVDALQVLRAFVGDISKEELKGDCDVNNDTKVNAVDALQILRFFVGDINSFD